MKGKRPSHCYMCSSKYYDKFKKFVYNTLKMWLCVDCYDVVKDLKPGKRRK